MDIDKLEAGPDLDALVAEKVMGWKGREQELWSEMATGKVTDWGTDNCTPGCVTTHTHFRPSSDMCAAWEVVKKFGGQSVWLNSNPGVWRFEIIGLDPARFAGGFVEAIANAAPLAICRAALKAVSSVS